MPEAVDFDGWADRLSLDWRGDDAGGTRHTIDLFQELGAERHLDLRIWFDELELFGPSGDAVSLDDFAAAGKRWWEGFAARDPRTQQWYTTPTAGLSIPDAARRRA